MTPRPTLITEQQEWDTKIAEIERRYEAAKAEFFNPELHGCIDGKPMTPELLTKRKEVHDRYILLQQELQAARIMRPKK
jgi:hypothetical protein